jgi:hypothetical protein
MTPTLANMFAAMWMITLVGFGALYLIAFKHDRLERKLQILSVGLGMCVATLMLLYSS